MKNKKDDLLIRKQKNYVVKSFTKEIADVDLTKRIVTGFYNTANYFDHDNDVVLKGSANKSISERGPDSTSICKIKHLLFHDWTQLPGKILTLKEQNKNIQGQNLTGLYFETQMSDTTLGNDTLINYQEKIYDNHSIGFQYLDGEFVDSEADNWKQILDTLVNPKDAEDAGYMYLWKEIKLYEGSTVAFGANALTPYLGVKNIKNKNLMRLKVNDRIDTLSRQIKSGGQSDETLQTFEMQMLQLKQIISELFDKPTMQNTRNKTARRESKDASDTDIVCDDCGESFTYTDDDVMQNDDGEDYVDCPNCGEEVLCDSGKSYESFSVKQLLNIF